MKKRFLTVAVLTVLATGLAGCSFSFGTGSNASTAKPVAANAPAANNNSASTAKTDSAAKPALTNEKKPDGNAKTANRKNPVPANWVYVYDENKGYGFSLPEGSRGEVEKIEGIDVMSATTPAPSEVDIFVLSYTDETLTKEDLLDDAVKFLEGLGQKVTPGKLNAESEEYAVADATSEHPTRGKGKLRILVGTDITDNYVMIIGTEEAKFAANESIIDAIWGSFEMWSGGGSSQ